MSGALRFVALTAQPPEPIGETTQDEDRGNACEGPTAQSHGEVFVAEVESPSAADEHGEHNQRS